MKKNRISGKKPKQVERPVSKRPVKKNAQEKREPIRKEDYLIRLNRFIANSGLCSRRQADEYIRSGKITVNGEVVKEMGHKVARSAVVKYNGKALKSERFVYLLLNKPKNYITTSSDPNDRKTVMQLVEHKCKERILPVGRLDRNTLGLLLFTNDGDLAKKLTHPSYQVKKTYHVLLDKALKKEDLKQIKAGVTLDDGPAHVDAIAYPNPLESKREIGIELHSGKNRIVRRIFESLGYEVVKLDRVYFAGLTKKNLPRGRSRFLSKMEIGMLKMM